MLLVASAERILSVRSPSNTARARAGSSKFIRMLSAVEGPSIPSTLSVSVGPTAMMGEPSMGNKQEEYSRPAHRELHALGQTLIPTIYYTGSRTDREWFAKKC